MPKQVPNALLPGTSLWFNWKVSDDSSLIQEQNLENQLE